MKKSNRFVQWLVKLKLLQAKEEQTIVRYVVDCVDTVRTPAGALLWGFRDLKPESGSAKTVFHPISRDKEVLTQVQQWLDMGATLITRNREYTDLHTPNGKGIIRYHFGDQIAEFPLSISFKCDGRTVRQDCNSIAELPVGIPLTILRRG